MRQCSECHEVEQHMSGCPNESSDLAIAAAEEASSAQAQYDLAKMERDMAVMRTWPEYRLIPGINA